MNISVNDNMYWLGFWSIVAIVVISTSLVEKFDNATKKEIDPIAQRIQVISESNMFSEDKAMLIKQLLASNTNIAEIVLEKK